MDNEVEVPDQSKMAKKTEEVVTDAASVNVTTKTGGDSKDQPSLRVKKAKAGGSNEHSVRVKKNAGSKEQHSVRVTKKSAEKEQKSVRAPRAKKEAEVTNGDAMSVNQPTVKKPPPKEANKPKAVQKKAKVQAREKMKDGEMVKSENFTWKVIKLLGSGGFGDVYRVHKEKSDDKKEYAMKTEMVEGDKRMLRLKIEVTVLKQCFEAATPEQRKHFVEFVDRGITEKFKFLVMGLIGPSLDDIRKTYLCKNFTRSTAMQTIIQTLKSIENLHTLGWLHRDIKPQNFAVGLNEKENTVYMLDFGIARKIFKGDTTELKTPRAKVKFLGTIRFAARACHHGRDQGRKDDLETWLFMAYDLLDTEMGLPWKRAADRNGVIISKEKFFLHMYTKPYRIVPNQFKYLLDYIDNLKYADEPDYPHIHDTLKKIAKDNQISLDRKLEWMGKLKKKNNGTKGEKTTSETSSDNRQSGSDSGDSIKEMKSVRKKGAQSKKKGH